MSKHPFDPRVVERVAEPTIAVRLQIPMAEVDMGELFGRELPRVWGRMMALGGSMGAAPYGRYFAWGPETADVEIGVGLAQPIEGLQPLASVPPGEIGASELPAGRVAIATHWGPYDTMPSMYRQLGEWMAAEGLTSGGAPWESYVDDPESVPDKGDIRTEVCFPLG